MKLKSCINVKPKFIIFSAVIIIIAISLLFFFIAKNKQTNQNATNTDLNTIPTVSTEKIIKHVIPRTITSYGTTISPNSMVIRPQSSGVLLSVEFKPGEKINKGQLLFKLKSNDVDNQSQTLKEQLRTSKSQYERYFKQNQELPGSISEMDLLTAKSQYQQDLTAYKEVGDFENIHAPIAGVITEADISPGDFVTEGQELAEIIDADILQVKYQLSSQYADLTKLGQKIYFYPEDNNKKDSIYMGTVTYISPQLDQDTYDLVIRADIPRAKNLRPNHFGKVTQVIDDTYSALAIPQGLVKTDEKGFYFYTVIHAKQTNKKQEQDQPDQIKDLYKIKKQYFTPGQVSQFGLIEINSHINPDTLMIKSYSSEITPGETVRLAD